MKTNNLIQEKSFAFAVRVVNLYKHLIKDKQEFVMSKQLLRSGTSIGANVEEAIGGQSEADFFTKLTIAYKEARESIYWIRLLAATNYLNEKEVTSINNDLEELCKIIGSIQISLKNKKNYQN